MLHKIFNKITDTLEMNTVMELLDSEYQDCEIRNFAIKHLQKYRADQILLYSKQIV